MKLALSNHIREIDAYASEKLGFSMRELMGRSGDAVARVVRENVDRGADVIILAGSGNNGGDGYAAAVQLMRDYPITVYDVFSAGQRTEEGRFYLESYIGMGGTVVDLELNEVTKNHILNCDVIVDAVFGTGFRGENPEIIYRLSEIVRSSLKAKKIAVDVPIGINADNGSVSSCATAVDYTVVLSMLKPGIVSYPAKAYVGKLVYSDLGLPIGELCKKFEFKYNLTDECWARENLPRRADNSNKGSFGKVLAVTGSAKYRGAAHLSVSASLRGGAGFTAFYGTGALVDSLSSVYPEVIYYTHADEREAEKLADLSAKHTVTLIGSGSENTDNMVECVLKLLDSEGGTLVLDADAINALTTLGVDGVRAIRQAKRTVILTPHPLEFARLTGNSVDVVQLHRIEAAVKFAAENRCIVVLKGAATLVTDGSEVYINGSGSSALAKAGSGDVLAGFLASFTASSGLPPLISAAFAVYCHGRAADNLSREYSTYGVTPSDLPLEMARCIAEIEGK